MIRNEDDCVGCGLHCLGNACPYKNAPHLYCDKCGEEYEVLYKYDYEELCKDCLLEEFPKVVIE